MEMSSKVNLALLRLTHLKVLSVHYCALSLPNKRLNEMKKGELICAMWQLKTIVVYCFFTVLNMSYICFCDCAFLIGVAIGNTWIGMS